jgi:hypothetical protein
VTDSDTTLYFDDICDLFVELGAHNPPGELHGLLTGQLCAGLHAGEDVWLANALKFMEPQNQPGAAARRELREVYQATLAQLEHPDNIFYPLLPDDDVELPERMRSLGHWCNGFLAGFSLVNHSGEQRHFPPVVSDALKDIAAVSREGAETAEQLALADDDENEEDYMEIVEYVRVLAMNIYLECGVEDIAGKVQKDAQKNTAHGTRHLFDKPLH